MSKESLTPKTTDIPAGISMAVSQNPFLYGLFDRLDPAERESLVSRSSHSHVRHDNEITGDMLIGRVTREDKRNLYN